MTRSTIAGACALALAAAGLSAPQAASAQDAATDHSGRDDGTPDSNTSWKYFYFHKADASEEQARADIMECASYARGLVVMEAGSSDTYSSVPYTTGLNLAQSALAGAIGGLVGGIITGFMDAGERRAMERTNLRKCFAFKGYDRYELTKEEFEALYEGEREEVRDRLIARATGQAPQAERLVR
ncbi:MAG: hypothetical protein V2I39_07515 [Erythrobacter sp.]|nr:hypothetical protein [Erythrobacter sp.]